MAKLAAGQCIRVLTVPLRLPTSTGHLIQPAEIHLGLRAGFMPPKIPYGPLHRLFNEPIISRGLELAETRREFELALGKGAIAMQGG